MTEQSIYIARVKIIVRSSVVLTSLPLLTLAIRLISKSNSPVLVSGSLVFIAALVSFPVYTTMPTAEPAARTVFAQRMFSTFNGMISGCDELDARIVKFPTKVWISLIGASAGNSTSGM